MVAQTHRVTQEWLASEHACPNDRALLGDRSLTVAEAFEAALDAGREDLCMWFTSRLLRRLDPGALAGFAARRARSVEHLWPDEARDCCKRAVALAERVAAGESVPSYRADSVAELCRSATAGFAWSALVRGNARSAAAWFAIESAASAAMAARGDPADTWGAVWGKWAAQQAAWAAAKADGERAGRASWLEAAADLQAMLDTAGGGAQRVSFTARNGEGVADARG
jgi:hypothetical protein